MVSIALVQSFRSLGFSPHVELAVKRLALSVAVCAMVWFFSQAAEAQWVYRPVMVAPRPAPVMVRQPMVVYQPTTVVYQRRRPILGGYSVRTRPGVQRTVVW